MPTRRGMTTSPVKGRPSIKMQNGKAHGLVVKVWDAHAKSLLSFSLHERVHSWTTVHVSQLLLHFKIQRPFCPWNNNSSIFWQIFFSLCYKLAVFLNWFFLQTQQLVALNWVDWAPYLDENKISFWEKTNRLTFLQDMKLKIRKEREYPVEIQRLYHKNQELQDQAILSEVIA